MSGFLQALQSTHSDLCDPDSATVPEMPVDKLKSMESTPPAADIAEQRADDDDEEERPAQQSRDECDARTTEQQEQRTDDEKEQLQIDATQVIFAPALAAKIGKGGDGCGSSGSKGAVPTAKCESKGRRKAEQLSNTPTRISSRVTGTQAIVELAESADLVTPQKESKAVAAPTQTQGKCSKQSQVVDAEEHVPISAEEKEAEPTADDAEDTTVQPSRKRTAAEAFECEQGVSDSNRRIEALEAVEAALRSDNDLDRMAAAQKLSDGMAEGWVSPSTGSDLLRKLEIDSGDRDEASVLEINAGDALVPDACASTAVDSAACARAAAAATDEPLAPATPVDAFVGAGAAAQADDDEEPPTKRSRDETLAPATAVDAFAGAGAAAKAYDDEERAPAPVDAAALDPGAPLACPEHGKQSPCEESPHCQKYKKAMDAFSAKMDALSISAKTSAVAGAEATVAEAAAVPDTAASAEAPAIAVAAIAGVSAAASATGVAAATTQGIPSVPIGPPSVLAPPMAADANARAATAASNEAPASAAPQPPVSFSSNEQNKDASSTNETTGDAPPQNLTPGSRGAALAAGMSREKYRADWMKYVRSLDSARTRGNYGDKVPQELSLKIVDSASKKYWFTIWLENNQKWGEVMATEEFKKSLCDTDETVEAWLTEAQWADLYKSPV